MSSERSRGEAHGAFPDVCPPGAGAPLEARAAPRFPRRAVLGLLLLSGCGFRPLHGERAGSPTVAAGLETIRVGLIPERNGQLLRRNLEDRLRSGQAPVRYDLRVGLSYGIELQGFARDGAPSRVRVTASSNWFLFDTASPPRLVARGTERAFDAYNVPENQFFAAETSRLATEQRLIDQLAEDIVRRLSVRFEAGPPQPT